MAREQRSRSPILVTGSHRSGTTWVGKMLSFSRSVGYINEPFNIQWCRPGICSAKFDHWFPYITKENESIFYDHIKNTLEFRYNIIEELKAIRSPKDIARMFRDYVKCSMYHFRNATPLIKESLCIFSAEWLASTFDMDVVVLIRHPAAFASSLKRKNWTFQFSNLLEQPSLMRDHLHPFIDEIREYADKDQDIVAQASLLWKAIYHTVSQYKKQHPDWIFLRHEDLSRDPLGGFQTLFEKLNIEFSEYIREMIRKYSDPANPSEAHEGVTHSLRRDSRSNIWNWKTRLTSSEIEKIRSQVGDISAVFYSDKDW